MQLLAAECALIQLMAYICLAKLPHVCCCAIPLDRQYTLTASVEGKDRRTIRASFYPAVNLFLPDRVVCHALYRGEETEAPAVLTYDTQDLVEMRFFHVGKFDCPVPIEICRANRGKPAEPGSDVVSGSAAHEHRLVPNHDHIPDCEPGASLLITLDNDDFVAAVAIHIRQSWREIFENEAFRQPNGRYPMAFAASCAWSQLGKKVGMSVEATHDFVRVAISRIGEPGPDRLRSRQVLSRRQSWCQGEYQSKYP
ncbi:hypothetical protein C0V75_21120 [Tabrizicola sp. TH137]|nr:hypothetical protein C0V75_21120 [Tabrizicola sp. TH137]